MDYTQIGAADLMHVGLLLKKILDPLSNRLNTEDLQCIRAYFCSKDWAARASADMPKGGLDALKHKMTKHQVVALVRAINIHLAHVKPGAAEAIAGCACICLQMTISEQKTADAVTESVHEAACRGNGQCFNR